MSRRKQLNPRPLGSEYTRTKSQEHSTNDQGEICKKTSQKTFKEHMVVSDEEDDNPNLVIDGACIKANDARITSDHFPLSYTFSPSLICQKPTSSTGHSSLSPQSPFSNGDATSSPMTGSAETLNDATKGKKPLKVPVKRKSTYKILPTGKDGQNGYVCPQCNTFVCTQHELTSHLRSHNGVNNSRSEHQCRQCWKILSSSSSLDRHMLTHSGEKPFSCRICKQSFTTNGNMHRHMRTHEKKDEQRRAALLKPKTKSSSSSSTKIKDFFTDVEVSVVKNSFKLSKNVEITSENILKDNWPSPSTLTNIHKTPAPDSQVEVNLKPSLPPYQNDEVHDLSPKPVLKFTLPVPPAESPSKYSLPSSPRSSPLNSITTVEFSSSKFPLICIAEGSKGASRWPKLGQQEYGCDDCQLYFPCKKALDLHLQTHYTDQPTSCRLCDLTFSSPVKYQQHCYRYHTDGTDEYQAVFMNSLNLISNQNTPKMTDASLSPPSSSSSSSSSSVNGIDESSLVKHCPLSEDDGTPSVSSLQEGDEDCHQDIKPIIISTSKEDDLNDDLQYIAENDLNAEQDEHSKTTSPICVSTEKAFNGSAKKKSSYTCTYCSKDFNNTRAAKSHERSHLGLSPYQCKSCSYSSPDKSTLIRHMRTHNGERPYQCKLCNYAFTTKANCERHVKKKHNIIKKEELESKVGYNKDTKESQDDSFSSPDTVCKYCNEDFKYFRRLKHHLRGHRSSEEKPFKCKQCEMGFSTKANCVRHIQNKHTDINHVNIENFVQMQESMFTSFMGHSGSPRCTSAPPAAHSPVIQFSDDSTEEMKPLDLRSSRNLSQSNSPSLNGSSFVCVEELDNNEPIDLSMKKPKKVNKKILNVPDLIVQCSLCDQEFVSESERQFHIKVTHNQNALVGERRSYPKQSTPSYHVSLGHEASLKDNIFSPFSKKIKLESNLHKDQASNIDCQSDDLASVSQILNTTGANSFEAYFANHQEDDPVPLKRPSNGHTSSPSEYANEKTQIKDEPCDLEDRDVTSDENKLPNSSAEAKDLLPPISLQPPPPPPVQEPEVDSAQKSQKKKRNSYADSPHKLKCPHCPRHFPWASSLNRHILTHTGEKPFECPKCHVIFSTKSNRERHLTRKHGVNMLDPAARQTMDRPFKCHLCTFSSFATKENLLRHYRDRHPEDPLPDGLSESAEKPSFNSPPPQQQQQNTKFTPGSTNSSTMEKKSPESKDKSLSNDCVKTPLKFPEREKTFKGDRIGTKSEEPKINIHNHQKWTQKADQKDNILTNAATVQNCLCYTCGYKINDPQLLQLHQEIHNEDLPFKCHKCDLSFAERIQCLKHLVDKHTAEWSRLTNKSFIMNPEQFSEEINQRCEDYVKQLSDCFEQNKPMSDYLDRKIFCSLCIERFWSKQDLSLHMCSHAVCQLNKKEVNIPSNVPKSHPHLLPTLPQSSTDISHRTEEPDILPTMLGMDASSIDRLLDSAMSGGHLASYIP